MKRNPWIWVAITVLVVGGIVLGVRLSEKPKYTPNYDIPYTSLGYNMAYPLDSTSCMPRNLLEGTYTPDENTIDHKAYRIIHSVAELEQILSRAGSLDTEIHTRELTFDDAFFEENALLLIDVISDTSAHVYARPEDLTEKDGIVTLTVRWRTDASYVASASGVLLSIPVSIDCVDADVTYEYADWRLN